jgi:hypothetical protein
MPHVWLDTVGLGGLTKTEAGRVVPQSGLRSTKHENDVGTVS